MSVDTVTKGIMGLLTTIDSMPDNTLARYIGTIIFEASVIKSGLISESLVDDYGFRPEKVCEDHYNSRQMAGLKFVLAHREKPLSYDDVVIMLEEFRRVHLVSSSENVKLSPIQNGDDTRYLSWQEQYELAGIRLVADRGRPPVWFYKTYVICSQTFNNIDDASRAVGLRYEEILKRCRSKARKWVDWQFFKRKEV